MGRSLLRRSSRSSTVRRAASAGALDPQSDRPSTGPSERREYIRDGRAPVPRRELTSRVMSANRGRDTRPEIQLRRQLWAVGLRGYRLHRTGIPGRPDVSFSAQRLAVFVHGCFWHRCPRCDLPLPRTHTNFWRAKFERNRLRDRQKALALTSTGWTVLTLWECEIEEDAPRCARKIARLLGRTSLHPKRSASTPERR